MVVLPGHSLLYTFKGCEIISPAKNFLVVKRKPEKAEAETGQVSTSLRLCELLLVVPYLTLGLISC